MSAAADTLHGTVIAVDGRAVLLRGPSGAGKSDLALRCIGWPAGGPLVPRPFRLVADDRVFAVAVGGVVSVSCPPSIAGLIEVRGVGIVRVEAVAQAQLALVIDLLVAGQRPERLPEPGRVEIAGVVVPQLRLDPFEASAPLKVMLALAQAYPNFHHDGGAAL